MARQIFIITKEGRNFTREGEQFILNLIKNKYGTPADTDFFEGPSFNKASLLADLISKPGKSVFIALSRAPEGDKNDHVMCFPPETMNELAGALRDPQFDGMTSWEILMETTKDFKAWND